MISFMWTANTPLTVTVYFSPKIICFCTNHIIMMLNFISTVCLSDLCFRLHEHELLTHCRWCLCVLWVEGDGGPMGIHTVGTEKMHINQALCSDVWDIAVKPKKLSLYTLFTNLNKTFQQLCTLHTLYMKSNDCELQSLKEEPRHHIWRAGTLTTGSIMLMYLHVCSLRFI